MTGIAGSDDLVRAREATTRVLREMGLTDYRFEIHPQPDDNWVINLECASGDGWAVLPVTVARPELIASLSDSAVRRRMASAWQRRLRACRARR